jgi:hypothetical protein
MTYLIHGVELNSIELTFVVECLMSNYSRYGASEACNAYITHLKEVCNEEEEVTKLTQTEEELWQCVLTLGRDYDLYLGYLEQLSKTLDGKSVITPATKSSYEFYCDELDELNESVFYDLTEMEAEAAREMFEIETNLPF